jgi:hypothetical protein
LEYDHRKGSRDAGGGGQVLGYQLTLFGPRGADYAHHITAGPSPIFLDDAASLGSHTVWALGRIANQWRHQLESLLWSAWHGR